MHRAPFQKVKVELLSQGLAKNAMGKEGTRRGKGSVAGRDQNVEKGELGSGRIYFAERLEALRSGKKKKKFAGSCQGGEP